MNISLTDFSKSVQQITETRYDCIWVRLAPRKTPSPIVSQGLQWVDWKLRGVLSRFIFEKFYENPLTTFVPTLKTLNTPYLAIDCEQGEKENPIKSFLKNSRGLKFNEVLFFCEDPSEVGAIEKQLREHGLDSCPRNVILGFDGVKGQERTA